MTKYLQELHNYTLREAISVRGTKNYKRHKGNKKKFDTKHDNKKTTTSATVNEHIKNQSVEQWRNFFDSGSVSQSAQMVFSYTWDDNDTYAWQRRHVSHGPRAHCSASVAIFSNFL